MKLYLWRGRFGNFSFFWILDKYNFLENITEIYFTKFLDAGIQDVSTSISIIHALIEISPDDDGDESDKHI